MKYKVNDPENYDRDMQLGETRGNSSKHSWRSNYDPSNENEKSYGKERRLVMVIVLLVMTVVALVVTLTLQIAVYRREEYGEMCQNVECVKTAARMLEAMNRSVDPCQDFYKFACGGWISENPIPQSQAYWDRMSFLREQLLRRLRILLEEPDKEYDPKSVKLARALYRTCMNTTSIEALGLKPIHETLIKLGLSKDPPSDVGNWTTDVSWFSGAAQRMLGLNLFVQFYVSEDLQDTRKNRITVSPRVTEHYLLNPQRFRAELNEYKKYVKNMVELAGAGNESVTFANEIFDFSTRLARTMDTSKERQNGSYLFHEVTIEELQQLTDPYARRFNWTRYIEAVFENTNVTIDAKTDHVIVINLHTLQKLPELLATTPARTIERFLWWSVYSTVTPLTLQQFRDVVFQFLQNVLGLKEQRARWKDCTENANANFGMALSYVYAKKYLNEQTRKKALEMLQDVKDAYDEMIAELDWMDVATRSRAHDKLHATRLYVGIPEWITDSDKLDKYYEGSEIVSGKLFETFLRLTDAGIKKSLNSLREKPDKSRWISTGTAVNAFYSATLNSVTFPAGILHPPFYGNGLESINYGAMGAIMGHELTHGFDDQGRRYDEAGNVRQWWSEETLQHYQKKVECIIKQYGNYRVPELGENFTVNGVNTQGENIADNGGIREAYRAYQKHKARSDTVSRTLPGFAGYTQDQLFFLGFAQVWCGNYTNSALKSILIERVHPPNHFRVIGTLSNNANFAKAWNCPIGSPMNPVNKCILW
ncbi:neprilysin-11 isoform X2 [Nomia melanderi]|uniref:neprilysin-11 isoform X2 n=1 Tax=Nomia melanderi TaxID=2448451 RepID=UPI0013043C69|nr:neprilysin-4-like isoform X2 [Nomia melanderi]XP_031835166.1 neprilysin-4-like isoform X2 [Nomia melanderi]XP_031835167.1 neprilysin-4-like isoform X2 [Nomia melanderi]